MLKRSLILSSMLLLTTQANAAMYLGKDAQGYRWTFLEGRIVHKSVNIKESWAFQERGRDKRKILYSFNCANDSISTLAIDDYKVNRGRSDTLISSWRNPNPRNSYYAVSPNSFQRMMIDYVCY